MNAPPFEGLSHFQLQVSDLDGSVAWYERALGLTKLRGDPGRCIALQSTTGRFRVVLSTGGRAGASGALDHIAFAISGLDALTEWCEHLTSSGITHEGIKRNIAGHSVDLFDPDGNNIELVSERSGARARRTRPTARQPTYCDRRNGMSAGRNHSVMAINGVSVTSMR